MINHFEKATLSKKYDSFYLKENQCKWPQHIKILFKFIL